LGTRADFLPLDLDQISAGELGRLVSAYDLVVQAAGPFRLRPPHLLQACIDAGVNYVDVCDDRAATEARLRLDGAARAAGITALIDTGTFPGIDNVMVAAALGQRPQADSVRLHFVCAGSGGGGFGVLQTMFLAVSRPHPQWVAGQWQATPSYQQGVTVDFGPPLGRRAVYDFEVPELWSLVQTFPQLQSCTSKFGSIPALWNWATRALAAAPARWRTDPRFLDNSATFILPTVYWVDQWVGERLGICVEIDGPDGPPEQWSFFAQSTCDAVGWATGLAAAWVLDGTVQERGVLLPETHLPAWPYLHALTARGGVLRRQVAQAVGARPYASGEPLLCE
jgi:hypothetical protein